MMELGKGPAKVDSHDAKSLQNMADDLSFSVTEIYANSNNFNIVPGQKLTNSISGYAQYPPKEQDQNLAY